VTKHTEKKGGLWPEEIEAWRKIDSGQTEMVTKTAEQFHANMKRYIDARKKAVKRPATIS
jgi:hypothetical protein